MGNQTTVTKVIGAMGIGTFLSWLICALLEKQFGLVANTETIGGLAAGICLLLCYVLPGEKPAEK